MEKEGAGTGERVRKIRRNRWGTHCAPENTERRCNLWDATHSGSPPLPDRDFYNCLIDNNGKGLIAVSNLSIHTDLSHFQARVDPEHVCEKA